MRRTTHTRKSRRTASTSRKRTRSRSKIPTRQPETSAMHNPDRQFCRRTRREFLWEAGAGFGALGLTGLLHNDSLLANAPTPDAHKVATKFTNPMAPKKPMFPAKAKAVIFLFMYG